MIWAFLIAMLILLFLWIVPDLNLGLLGVSAAAAIGLLNWQKAELKSRTQRLTFNSNALPSLMAFFAIFFVAIAAYTSFRPMRSIEVVGFLLIFTVPLTYWFWRHWDRIFEPLEWVSNRERTFFRVASFGSSACSTVALIIIVNGIFDASPVQSFESLGENIRQNMLGRGPPSFYVEVRNPVRTLVGLEFNAMESVSFPQGVDARAFRPSDWKVKLMYKRAFCEFLG